MEPAQDWYAIEAPEQVERFAGELKDAVQRIQDARSSREAVGVVLAQGGHSVTKGSRSSPQARCTGTGAVHSLSADSIHPGGVVVGGPALRS